MITPRLPVDDMARAVAFYRDMLGLTVDMAVMGEGDFRDDGVTEGAEHVQLSWSSGQIMLQTRASLARDDLPLGGVAHVYLRGFGVDQISAKIAARHVIRGPLQTWYGMEEIFVHDPDGHVLCLGAPIGKAPD